MFGDICMAIIKSNNQVNGDDGVWVGSGSRLRGEWGSGGEGV